MPKKPLSAEKELSGHHQSEVEEVWNNGGGRFQKAEGLFVIVGALLFLS